MDPHYRSLFNGAFSGAMYAAYQADFEERTGTSCPFRLAETPVFLPSDLKARLVDAATEILRQISDAARIERMKEAIPAAWHAPGIDHLPSFTQIDFAIVRDEHGALAPRLIELQGFPSLTAMQVLQCDSWSATLDTIDGLDRTWSCWFSDLDRDSFLDLARRTIVGDNDPGEVILMDIDPREQKTYPDFAATKTLFGVEAVDPRDLVREGKRLWRRREDRAAMTPVRRIYNRVVFDELIARGLRLPFDYRDELEVEWAPHPNWYWIWSKYSLPFLDHPAVPAATFVSDLTAIPDDLETRYVLKPLFSFAGGGVNVEPRAADLARIPVEERHSWCIQEKITYEPALVAADGGGVKVEIRMMFLRPDDEREPILAQNLCRLARGKMLGVDFNKDLTWVGSSIGIFPS
ncbi:MAG TPA: hypothetical protein VMT00_10475 [Thermoanaerobaculia bacterium]|nr:hypothetical protein [Thermoanaerobaculia bacterium]